MAISPEAATNDEFVVKGLDFSEKKIRMAFVRKVYSILMVQLLVTLGIMIVFMFPAKNYMEENYFPIFFVSWIMTIILLIWISCFEEARRKTPMNYILLFAFTICEGLVLSTATMKISPEMFALAVGITAVICFSLTCFAFQTKWDFTGLGTFLFVTLICLILFAALTSIIVFYYPGSFEIWRVAISILGALLFSFYLIRDTQLMIGGKHKYSISPEEYVTATLNIYLDIVNIFMCIIGASR